MHIVCYSNCWPSVYSVQAWTGACIGCNIAIDRCHGISSAYNLLYTVAMTTVQVQYVWTLTLSVANRNESITDECCTVEVNNHSVLLSFSFAVTLSLTFIVATRHILFLISWLAFSKYGSTPSRSVCLVQRCSYCPRKQLKLWASRSFSCR